MESKQLILPPDVERAAGIALADDLRNVVAFINGEAERQRKWAGFAPLIRWLLVRSGYGSHPRRARALLVWYGVWAASLAAAFTYSLVEGAVGDGVAWLILGPGILFAGIFVVWAVVGLVGDTPRRACVWCKKCGDRTVLQAETTLGDLCALCFKEHGLGEHLQRWRQSLARHTRNSELAEEAGLHHHFDVDDELRTRTFYVRALFHEAIRRAAARQWGGFLAAKEVWMEHQTGEQVGAASVELGEQRLRVVERLTNHLDIPMENVRLVGGRVGALVFTEIPMLGPIVTLLVPRPDLE